MSAPAAGTAAAPALRRWHRGRTATLGLYWNFARLAFLKFLAYRLRYYTGVVSYTVFVAGNAFLYSALYHSRPEAEPVIGGLTLAQMVGYVILSWVGRSFYFNNIDRTLAHQIVQGEIAMELIKPYHVQTVQMSEALGEGLFRMLMFTLPILVVVTPLFGLPAPPHPSLYGWTLLSFLLAFLVNAQVNFLVGCLAFFLKNIVGVIRAKMILMEFLTGVLIPFSFFPGWVQSVMDWLPFQAISYIPVTVYLGLRPAGELQEALLIQGAWALGLFVAGRLVWNASVKRVTLQGG
ncbi:ABC-2 family transporter protein [bacterium]|nr:ABC-2 family transporter protein [bacterium]